MLSENCARYAHERSNVSRIRFRVLGLPYQNAMSCIYRSPISTPILECAISRRLQLIAEGGGLTGSDQAKDGPSRVSSTGEDFLAKQNFTIAPDVSQRESEFSFRAY
jgi:hypothetical protein